jgi:nucleoid DNA-binding protein
MAKTSDLINSIANKYNLSIADSKEIITIIFEYLSQKLSEKERIEIRSFGVFTMNVKKNNLNWKNKYSLCQQSVYNVINYKMSNNIHLKLN